MGKYFDLRFKTDRFKFLENFASSRFDCLTQVSEDTGTLAFSDVKRAIGAWVHIEVNVVPQASLQPPVRFFLIIFTAV